MPELRRVVIGIPTYNRPDRLERALACASRQRYPNLRVIVSDNASRGTAVDEVIERYRGRFADLVFIKQPYNLGALRNFFFLLAQAESEYFMWLADDDEISDNYVAELVALLERDAEAVSAAGSWFWLRTETGGQLMTSPDLSCRSVLRRAARFIWRGDDAFFYAMHRTEVLRRATFSGYAWPNRQAVLNWGYVYLFDLVLSGRILQHPDPAVRFINHGYTTKAYAVSSGRVAGLVKSALRRINVHYFYLRKTASALGLVSCLAIATVAIIRLGREAVESVHTRTIGRWRALRARRT